jgi:hypothetical protein
VGTIREDFEMPELLLPIQDYDSSGAWTDRGNRRSRSVSGSRKKRRSRNSSRSKSTKSEKASRGRNKVVEEIEIGSKRNRSENLSHAVRGRQ